MKSWSWNIRQIILMVVALLLFPQAAIAANDTRVTFESDGWQIVGNLHVPETTVPPPVVIMLHTMWRGNRSQYDNLARTLGDAGLASLRIDLRGHGDSINKGKLEYLAIEPELIFDGWPDVIAARKFLEARLDIDADKLGVISASYSGEVAAKAGRSGGYADAYIVLASGLLSLMSVFRMQVAEVPFLFVFAEDDHTWAPKMAEFVTKRKFGELWTYKEGGHATALLQSQPELPARLTDWLKEKLRYE